MSAMSRGRRHEALLPLVRALEVGCLPRRSSPRTPSALTYFVSWGSRPRSFLPFHVPVPQLCLEDSDSLHSDDVRSDDLHSDDLHSDDLHSDIALKLLEMAYREKPLFALIMMVRRLQSSLGGGVFLPSILSACRGRSMECRLRAEPRTGELVADTVERVGSVEMSA